MGMFDNMVGLMENELETVRTSMVLMFYPSFLKMHSSSNVVANSFNGIIS